MASFVNGVFNIPDGYVEEKIDGQLCHEDLDEDSELWLIRVPSDIPLSNLDKKRIYLGSNSNDTNVKTIKCENGKVLECYAENSDIPNICVVLPEKSGKKLQAVRKTFKGVILIAEGLSLNDDTEVKSEINDEPQAAMMDDISNLTREPKRKKNKKKSKDFDRDELNYETEDADNASLPVRKRKDSIKCQEVNNGHNESVQIKNEPESMDSDGFP